MRRFPNPTKDQQIAFLYHSTRIEREPLSKKEIDETLSNSKIHPHVEGHLKCLNLMKTFAQQDDLIPDPELIQPYTIHDHTSWIKSLHKNLFKTIAEEGYMKQDFNVIRPADVGRWRDTRHWVAGKEMPNPFSIDKHLYNWYKDLAIFHKNYKMKIEQPHLLEKDDIEQLVNKAYETNLKLCCIKPFTDGSNRIARLVENTIRLNWGLPLKIIRHEDEYKLPYINDIQKMQEQYPTDLS